MNRYRLIDQVSVYLQDRSNNNILTNINEWYQTSCNLLGDLAEFLRIRTSPPTTGKHWDSRVIIDGFSFLCATHFLSWLQNQACTIFIASKKLVFSAYYILPGLTSPASTKSFPLLAWLEETRPISSTESKDIFKVILDSNSCLVFLDR